jgi:hypothetical protein
MNFYTLQMHTFVMDSFEIWWLNNKNAFGWGRGGHFILFHCINYVEQFYFCIYILGNILDFTTVCHYNSSFHYRVSLLTILLIFPIGYMSCYHVSWYPPFANVPYLFSYVYPFIQFEMLQTGYYFFSSSFENHFIHLVCLLQEKHFTSP